MIKAPTGYVVVPCNTMVELRNWLIEKIGRWEAIKADLLAAGVDEDPLIECFLRSDRRSLEKVNDFILSNFYENR